LLREHCFKQTRSAKKFSKKSKFNDSTYSEILIKFKTEEAAHVAYRKLVSQSSASFGGDKIKVTKVLESIKESSSDKTANSGSSENTSKKVSPASSNEETKVEATESKEKASILNNPKMKQLKNNNIEEVE